MISVCSKAIYAKKTISKKKASEIGLDAETTAKVMAYCLFIHQYLKARNVKINDHFAFICLHMSNVNKEYFGQEKEEEQYRERWRRASDWGLHFLSAPIAIVDYGKVNSKMKFE